MSTNKKILVSDYDRTFYINDEDIEINKSTITKFRKKGNLFIIATGRSYFDFNNKKDLYNIEYDYLILNHGATILDPNDNIIFNSAINNDIIADLKNDLELEKTLQTFCCSELESRVDFEHKYLTKIHVKYKDRGTLIRVSNRINEKYSQYINTYFINENGMEIISSKTDKSLAIELLLKYLPKTKYDIYTIGDGYSDIEMIKKFNGYCMKESVEELKTLAIKDFESVSALVNELIDHLGTR